jgi:hypothetical protein
MKKSQRNTSDSLLPPSRLPMDLTQEEGKGWSRKRAFPEMDLSEWGITCKEFCPRRGKQSDNSGKKPRQQASKPKEFPPRICYKCRQPGHYANTCPNPRLDKPRPQRRDPKQVRVIRSRSKTFKESKISVISWVLFLFENIYLYDLLSIVVREQPPVDFLMVMIMLLEALSYPC